MAAASAWALCGVSFALVGSFVWLEAVHHRTLGSAELQFDGGSALFGVFYPVVGAFLVSRRKDNPVGWLLIVIGLSLAASAPVHAYSQWGPLLGPAAPRFGQLAAWVGTWVWAR